MRPEHADLCDTHPSAAGWGRLTPEEQRKIVDRIIAQARTARARAIYDLLMKIPAATVAAATAVWRAGAALIARDRAIRGLSALDDRSLRDIGLNRAEIEAAVDGCGPLRGPEPFVRLERHKSTRQWSQSMTPERKRLIKETWSKLVPIADTAAKLFYNRLFEIDPSTRPLFRVTNMAEQRKKLVGTLSAALQSLDNLDALIPVIETMGRRHAGYGVTDAHYDSVGAALLWTLEQGLGKVWTPEAAAAWTELYGVLSSVMQRAANETAKHAA